MSYTNYADAMAQITSAGIMIDKPLNLDARIQRWKVDGEDRERRGWTRLKEWRSSVGVTYIVGVYGIWHGNDDGMVKIDLPTKSTPDRPPLTAEDIAAIRAAQKESQRKIAEERKREAKQASRWAAAAWSGCVAAPADHEYLVRKQIQPHGLRVMVDTEGMLLTGLDESNFYRLKMATGALVVPMHDEQGVVCGIQFIYPKGHERAKKLQRDKEFWPSGMAMGGTFGMIGPIKRGGIMLIGEGFATMASLYEATGQTVVYAFSANNLVKAGKLIRKSCPGAHLLFCADDDYLTDGNPGVIAASNATAEIERSAWIKPDFAGEDGADLRNGKKLTDFNDLRILTGLTLPLANPDQRETGRIEMERWGCPAAR
jgi:putative DNA primase/helicase